MTHTRALGSGERRPNAAWYRGARRADKSSSHTVWRLGTIRKLATQFQRLTRFAFARTALVRLLCGPLAPHPQHLPSLAHRQVQPADQGEGDYPRPVEDSGLGRVAGRLACSCLEKRTVFRLTNPQLGQRATGQSGKLRDRWKSWASGQVALKFSMNEGRHLASRRSPGRRRRPPSGLRLAGATTAGTPTAVHW